MGYTLLNPKVVKTIQSIDNTLEDTYVLNGGIAVQAYLAAAVANSNGHKGDISQILGLKKIFRETEDIDIVVSDKVDALSRIYKSEFSTWKENANRPRGRGELISYEHFNKSKPRIDLWIGYNDFDKRMVQTGRGMTLTYENDEFEVRVPPIEYLVALKLFETNPESRHMKDIAVLKSFTNAGLLKVDEAALRELVELRHRSKEPFKLWRN
jgi:hypothetical protein